MAGGIGDLLGHSTLGAAIEAALSLQKTEHLNLNKLFNVPDYRSSVIARPEPVIVQYPPREVFREVEILKEIITPEYDREIPDEYEVLVVPEEILLESRLRDIDRGLPNLLQGARLASSTDNPDRARHVTVSLRELIGHVLVTWHPITAYEIGRMIPVITMGADPPGKLGCYTSAEKSMLMIYPNLLMLK